MDAKEFLTSLRKRNFLVRLKDGALEVLPFPKLTATDREALRVHTPALVRMLSEEPSPADAQVIDTVLEEFPENRLIKIGNPQPRQPSPTIEQPKPAAKPINCKPAPVAKSEKSGMAELIVKTHLRDGQPHISQPIIDLAMERGVSFETVLAAAKALGVKKQKDGSDGPWFWQLPSSETPEGARHAESASAEGPAVPESSGSLPCAEDELDSAEEDSMRPPGDQPSLFIADTPPYERVCAACSYRCLNPERTVCANCGAPLDSALALSESPPPEETAPTIRAIHEPPKPGPDVQPAASSPEPPASPAPKPPPTKEPDDLQALRDHIRSRRAVLAGFMEQGADLWFEDGTLTVFPRNEIYIRYLADNRKVIGELATEFFGCAVTVEVAGPTADMKPVNQRR